MIIWGISANSHDSSLAVFENNHLVFASHSERFSKIKNDPHLHPELINYALQLKGSPNLVCWYENPYKKTFRQLWAGQGWKWSENNIKKYLANFNIHAPIEYIDHHLSHAAAAYYTSNFDESAVLCIDSIGERTTTSIWKFSNNQKQLLYTKNYPISLGLFYSAMTHRIGLKPQEDEYILMGMASYGHAERLYDRIQNDFFKNNQLVENLYRGCKDWAPDLTSKQDLFDIAAATQLIYETQLKILLNLTKNLSKSNNLALAGGCALNCVANTLAFDFFDNVWIFPNPGDAGSSIGSVLAYNNSKIQFDSCYLGYDIQGEYPVKNLLQVLSQGLPVGVANGLAEFGPRALGNRSLLADPRNLSTKDLVNEIKQRQKFRPFAPAILEEFAGEYFEMPTSSSRFMQYAVTCKHPTLIPAVVHVDNSSRVQTVPPNNSGFRKLLEEWYEKTKCPILLNTSLNIKGMPMVNDVKDALLFKEKYQVDVFY